MTLGQRIRSARTRAGMTQTDVVTALALSGPAIVSNWENDRSVPEGPTLLQMPHVFGIDGHWLLTGEGEMLRTTPTRAEELVRQFRDLLDVPVRQGKSTKMG